MKFVTICFSVLLLSVLTTSQKHGEECKSRMCTNTRGYINYNGRQTLTKIWTITNKQIFTTIVIHLKNIAVPKDLTSLWLRIYIQQRDEVKKIEIQNSTEVVFSFTDANEAIIEVIDDENVEFTLIYYLGCAILEGNDITIKKAEFQLLKYMQYYSGFPKSEPKSICWFLFPITNQQKFFKRLQKKFINRGISWQLTREIEIKKLYLMFKDVRFPDVPNRTTVTVYDEIKDEEIMEAGGYETLVVNTVEKNTKRVLYSEEEYLLTNMIFVDMQCAQTESCRKSKFTLQSYGLQEEDMSCVQKQAKCLFNVGSNAYDCRANYSDPQTAVRQISSESLVTTSCPAFNYLSKNVLDEVIYINNRLAGPRTSAKETRGQCDIRQFCNFKKKCNRKALRIRGCDKLCFFVKRVLNLCGLTEYFG